MFHEYPDVVTIRQLMQMLHVGRNHAYRLVGDGSIRSIRIGTMHRIPKQSVIDYITRTAGLQTEVH